MQDVLPKSVEKLLAGMQEAGWEDIRLARKPGKIYIYGTIPQEQRDYYSPISTNNGRGKAYFCYLEDRNRVHSFQSLRPITTGSVCNLHHRCRFCMVQWYSSRSGNGHHCAGYINMGNTGGLDGFKKANRHLKFWGIEPYKPSAKERATWPLPEEI